MPHNPSRSTIFLGALTSGVGTLIVALIVGWLTLGRHAVGREEVIELIESRAPYVADRQALLNAVETNAEHIDQLARTIRELERQGHRVEAKLDLLLNEAAAKNTREAPKHGERTKQ